VSEADRLDAAPSHDYVVLRDTSDPSLYYRDVDGNVHARNCRGCEIERLRGALRSAQDEAHAILSLLVPAAGGRQFVDRGDFDKCLDFLARLSGDDQWDFLTLKWKEESFMASPTDETPRAAIAPERKPYGEPQTWYFTFGVGGRYAGRFYVIRNASGAEARDRMFETFGREWGFQYDEADWFKHGVSQEEKYGLEEISGP